MEDLVSANDDHSQRARPEGENAPIGLPQGIQLCFRRFGGEIDTIFFSGPVG